MAASFDAREVGVTVDTFNIWWDPELYPQIARAAGRIHSYQVSDWPIPLPDTFMGRAMMGDGVIELNRIRSAVQAAGYGGYIEVEIMNRAIWDMPGDDVLRLMKERYLAHV
jgi:sugar phosphate isomerase/epimerase